MASTFRRPNDVTDSTESDKSDEDPGIDQSSDPSPSKSPAEPAAHDLHRLKTIDSVGSGHTTTISYDQHQEVFTQEDDIKNGLIRTLLKRDAINASIKELEQQSLTGERFTEHDPLVQSLAAEKYEYTTRTISGIGAFPSAIDPEDSHASAIEQRVEDGYKFIASQAPGPGRSAIIHNDTSLAKLRSDMAQLAPLTSSSEKRGSMLQLSNIVRNAQAISNLPPLLQPFVDHPMVDESRYLRDFKEIRIIGKGGYGKVYHVQSRLDGSDYAVKKIALSSKRVSRIEERGHAELDVLLKELRMLAKFDHPNIVRYHSGWLEYSRGTNPAEVNTRGRLMRSPLPVIAETRPGASRHGSSRGGRYSDPERHQDIDYGRSASFDVNFEYTEGEVIGEIDDFHDEEEILQGLQAEIKSSDRHAHGSSPSATAGATSHSGRSVDVDDEDEPGNDWRDSRDIEEYSVDANKHGEDTENQEQSLILSSRRNESTTDDGLLSSSTRSGRGASLESTLTLHIQMTLHPLGLADYLNADPNLFEARERLRHCFHLQSSLQIMLAILDGVQYLHDCDVVHRDLKPSNVFLSYYQKRTLNCIDLGACTSCQAQDVKRDGFLGVRIGDFGLVTQIARAHETAQQVSSEKAVGTEMYRPPSDHTRPEEKLDVYALGILLTELLTPFGTQMERLFRLQDVRNGKQTASIFQARFGEEQGHTLHQLVQRMTDPDAHARVSCSKARDAIEQLLRLA